MNLDRAITSGRHAMRRLLRDPGFSVTVIVTLTLGLTSVICGFTLIQQILLRPLPYPSPGMLVSISSIGPTSSSADQGDNSEALYSYYRHYNRSFRDLGAYATNVVSLSDRGNPEQVDVALVSWTIFSMLDVRPLLGRTFSADDDEPGSNNVVVISEDLWQHRYGRDPSILGRIIELNRSPKQVVGVVSSHLAFPSQTTEVWYPLGLDPSALNNDDSYLHILGRLAPDVPIDQARLELSALHRSFGETYRYTPTAVRTEVIPLKDSVVGEISRSIQLFFGVGCCLLALVIANLTNLFLVRAEHRKHELAIKDALGAERIAVVFDFILESLLLVIPSACLALVCAFLGIRTHFWLSTDQVPRLGELTVNYSLLIAAGLLSVTVTLLFSSVCYLRVYRGSTVSTFVPNASRTVVGNEGLQRVIVLAQVALALVLTVGSIGMVRSVLHLHDVSVGMRSHGVIIGDISLPFTPYTDYSREQNFFARLRAVILKNSTDAEVGLTSALPLKVHPVDSVMPISLDMTDTTLENATAVAVIVSPELFHVVGIPLVAGRGFGFDDASAEWHPVIISSSVSRHVFGQLNSIGRRFFLGNQADRMECTVVGVVGDVPGEQVGSPADYLYFPLVEGGSNATLVPLLPHNFTIALHSHLPPASAEKLLQTSVQAVDPQLPITRLESLDELVADSRAETRIGAAVTTAGAIVASFLGILGMYGVTSYAVGRRAREIAVRIAVGAQHRDLIFDSLKRSCFTVLLGAILGAAISLLLTRYMQSLMFEVQASDPVVVASVALALLLAAELATYFPIKRACQNDVMQSLRLDA